MRDTGQRESKKGQLSPCDFRVFRAVGVSPLGPSLLSPKLCLWFPFGEHLAEMQGEGPGSGARPLVTPHCTPAPAHRRNKVLNHFSIMQQRRLKDQDQDEEDEEKEKRSRKKASELRIHDLEDDLEMSSDDSEASGEEGEPA